MTPLHLGQKDPAMYDCYYVCCFALFEQRFILPFFSCESSRFLLRVRMVRQLYRAR